MFPIQTTPFVKQLNIVNNVWIAQKQTKLKSLPKLKAYLEMGF